MRLSSRLGYGIGLHKGDLLLHPFTEMRFTNNSSHHITLGIALTAAAWNVECSGSSEGSSTSSL
ncbi:MAG: hypothetical protein TQ37_08125, partial [Candidatus Synechococcus spongiarum 15L]